MPSFMPSSLPLPKALYLVPLLVGCGALVQAATFWRGVQRARAFAAQGRRFERRVAAQGPRILILGDSTGVGVGATPAGGIDRRAARRRLSGCRRRQRQRVGREGRRPRWPRSAPAPNRACTSTSRCSMSAATMWCERRRPRSCRTIASSCSTSSAGWPNARSGSDRRTSRSTPLFTPPFSWVVAARSRAATAIFVECAARHGITFVNFSSPEHEAQFVRARAEHFAADRFHPSSSSYRYGWSVARRAVDFSAFAAQGGLSARASARGRRFGLQRVGRRPLARSEELRPRLRPLPTIAAWARAAR